MPVTESGKEHAEGLTSEDLTMAGLMAGISASNPMQEFDPEETELVEQGRTLEWLLPGVMRQIFAGSSNDPLNELPLGQFRLCILLFREGRRTMSQVSEDLGISVSAVTQMADRLEKVGMVERLAEPGGDRRTRFLCLTEYGQSLMGKRRQVRLARATAALRLLSPEERQQILAALETLREVSRNLNPTRLPGDDAPLQEPPTIEKETS